MHLQSFRERAWRAARFYEYAFINPIVSLSELLPRRLAGVPFATHNSITIRPVVQRERQRDAAKVHLHQRGTIWLPSLGHHDSTVSLLPLSHAVTSNH